MLSANLKQDTSSSDSSLKTPLTNRNSLREELLIAKNDSKQDLDNNINNANKSLEKFGWKVINKSFERIEDPNNKATPDAEFMANIRPITPSNSFPQTQVQFDRDGKIVALAMGAALLEGDNLKYTDHIMNAAKEGGPILAGKLPDGRAFVMIGKAQSDESTKISTLVFDKDDPSKFTEYEFNGDVPTTFGDPGNKKIEFTSKDGKKLILDCTINSEEDRQNGAPYYSNPKIGLDDASAVNLSTFEPK